ncbi:hypothetical protein BOTNAR_0275g00120 [Botryotinia narcissicola]|uniref:Uncharacterized protein n=1 Tax=Botryotinia narcissicola TaxID=278944 RepID=A0A4Z1HYM8_9HELO|nr:hypothetical protein BOTNAR_0275g00120 [Botryotinia narcissicola]
MTDCSTATGFLHSYRSVYATLVDTTKAEERATPTVSQPSTAPFTTLAAVSRATMNTMLKPKPLWTHSEEI